MKVNFDGALFLKENVAGLNIIVYDDHGLVVAALSRQIPLPALMEIVEVLVARWVLWFAQELGFESLVMEGDAEAIVNALNGDTMLLFVYGHILHDIKLMSSSVCNVSFKHIKQ